MLLVKISEAKLKSLKNQLISETLILSYDCISSFP
jgi:hypothetical protein